MSVEFSGVDFVMRLDLIIALWGIISEQIDFCLMNLKSMYFCSFISSNRKVYCSQKYLHLPLLVANVICIGVTVLFMGLAMKELHELSTVIEHVERASTPATTELSSPTGISIFHLYFQESSSSLLHLTHFCHASFKVSLSSGRVFAAK